MRLLLILTAFLAFISCNNKNAGDEKKKPDDTTIAVEPEKKVHEEKNSIVGIWAPIEFAMNRGQPTPEELKEMKESATIEFTASGNYISLFKGDRETGTYVYDTKAGTLVTKKESGSEERFSVAWDNGLLKLTMEDGKMTLQRQ